ncbi:hypothetical protein SAMN02745116_01431 [Pilibacter termitis]|uniref:Uncharacterized protein n=1 Tax=Pilibacter termitis TaxID=263852 RepID=A0A1T4NI74_9ENTE|nr:hypothetical protein [Pilibacter termitis]SJZ78952.1 hypothetical protein SAMN02745116_01431 [Pilibacter termitis]
MMKTQKKIYMVAQYIDYHLDELQTSIADWMILIRVLSEPATFQINQENARKFDVEEVISRIEHVSMEDDFWWRITGDAGEFQVHVYKGTLFFRNLFFDEVFFQNEPMIFDYFDHRMSEHGLYGYLRSYDEYLYSNTSRLEDRAIFEEEEITEKLPKMYNRHQRLIVDCNQLAGYDTFFKGLCLTSCWKMYFSKYYYNVIPRPILEEVQQVEEIETLENDVMKISLYKNPNNWQHEANQKSQRLFRDQIGVDGLAWSNGVGILREPFIEYAFTDNIVHTVQYQNQQGQPIEKKKATHFVTRTFDFLHDDYREQRMFGTLNSQAFFPWVDDAGRKMMNYRVLNPSLTLDEGASAYEFYIREFLEVELEDDKEYEHYTSVLRFYVPKHNIQKLPIEELKQRLEDVSFTELKNKTEYPSYDLKKGKNHLRIIFFDYEQLDFLHKVNRAE